MGEDILGIKIEQIGILYPDGLMLLPFALKTTKTL